MIGIEESVYEHPMDKIKSRSTDYLENRLHNLNSVTRAYSYRDISSEPSLELLMKRSGAAPSEQKSKAILSRGGNGKGKDSTLPITIKHAVSPTDVKARSNTDMLDQKLNKIRANLNILHSDRVEMESKMKTIIEGIQGMTRACSSTASGARFPFRRSSSGKSLLKTTQPQVTFCKEPTTNTISSSSSEHTLHRRSSVRKRITSIMLSPTQLIKHATLSSKPNTTLSSSFIRGESSSFRLHTSKSSHRVSLPESYTIGTIPEDIAEPFRTRKHSVDLTTYNRKMDIKSENSKRTLVRRSSLTGQLEHYFKLPDVKEDSYNNNNSINNRNDNNCNQDKAQTNKPPAPAERRLSRTQSIEAAKKKCLERRHPKVRNSVIILPCTETTV